MSAASSLPLPAPLLLNDAAQAYARELQGNRCPHAAEAALADLDRYLGSPAPLLAYTRPSGAAWIATLPAAEQPAARALLDEFRAFLRAGDWFDAARPVNLFD
ncbi:hypothetical protein [Deinococcus hohokamensis]|uniref:Uncharacterized protein n=1 Tax=Deinococcus hohokamensis TaxID=309883 RepID=A0ABV9I6C3_9DEIO